MSKMGRFAQEEQEREKARTASIYQAEIESLVEEVKKLKDRLNLLEVKDYYKDKDIVADSGYIVFDPNTTTVSRPKEVEEYIPWSGYVVIDSEGESMDSISSKSKRIKMLHTSPALSEKGARIIKVQEVYEANGDV